MNKLARLKHPLFSTVNNALVDLPAPTNISSWLNFGSLFGLCLIILTLTGLVFAIRYIADINLLFNSINHSFQDVKNGLKKDYCELYMRKELNLFFICIYLYIARGIYYESYLNIIWMVGVITLFLVTATAFIGFVLPWSQISFSGATVFTNLLLAIAYVDHNLVKWVWGGFEVDDTTRTRFFNFHFIVPCIVLAITITHLIFFHKTDLNNPTGLNSNADKIAIHSYFTFKDILALLLYY